MAATITDFLKCFNIDINTGSFSTTSAKTHGQMTLKNGKVCNVGRYDLLNRGGDGTTATNDAYMLRQELFDALVADDTKLDANALRDKLGLSEGENDRQKTAVPLSRRTIKQILASHFEAKTKDVDGQSDLEGKEWKVLTLPLSIAKHPLFARSDLRGSLPMMQRVYNFERMCGATDDAILLDLNSCEAHGKLSPMLRMAFNPQYLTNLETYAKGLLQMKEVPINTSTRITSSYPVNRVRTEVCTGIMKDPAVAARNSDMLERLGLTKGTTAFQTVLQRMNMQSARGAMSWLSKVMNLQSRYYTGPIPPASDQKAQLNFEFPRMTLPPAAEFALSESVPQNVRNAISTALSTGFADVKADADDRKAVFLSRVFSDDMLERLAEHPAKLDAILDECVREAKNLCDATEGKPELRNAFSAMLAYPCVDELRGKCMTENMISTVVTSVETVKKWMNDLLTNKRRLTAKELLELTKLFNNSFPDPEFKKNYGRSVQELSLGIIVMQGGFKTKVHGASLPDKFKRQDVVRIGRELYCHFDMLCELKPSSDYKEVIPDVADSKVLVPVDEMSFFGVSDDNDVLMRNTEIIQAAIRGDHDALDHFVAEDKHSVENVRNAANEVIDALQVLRCLLAATYDSYLQLETVDLNMADFLFQGFSLLGYPDEYENLRLYCSSDPQSSPPSESLVKDARTALNKYLDLHKNDKDRGEPVDLS